LFQPLIHQRLLCYNLLKIIYINITGFFFVFFYTVFTTFE